MKPKVIVLIVITVLVTIILMKNTDEVKFWIFGDTYIPKLAVLGTMFALGLIAGFILGRPRKKTITPLPTEDPIQRRTLSEEDEEYLN